MESSAFRGQLSNALGRNVPKGTPLGEIIEGWERSLHGMTLGSPADGQAAERHARQLASLCECLSAPDATKPEWAEQDRMDRHGDNWLWFLPLIHPSEKRTYWSPDQTLAGEAAAYLELGVVVPEPEALLLHGLLYQTAIERMAQLQEPQTGWRRRWGNLGPATASQCRWWALDPSEKEVPAKVGAAGSSLVPKLVGVAGAAILAPYGLGAAVVAGLGLYYLSKLARGEETGELGLPRPSLFDELAHVANSAAWLWREDDKASKLVRGPWTTSAEALRASMLATDAFGADWPGVAYRLVDRLAAQERFEVENPEVGPGVSYAA